MGGFYQTGQTGRTADRKEIKSSPINGEGKINSDFRAPELVKTFKRTGIKPREPGGYGRSSYCLGTRGNLQPD
jgi:hypothetical protein